MWILWGTISRCNFWECDQWPFPNSVKGWFNEGKAKGRKDLGRVLSKSVGNSNQKAGPVEKKGLLLQVL